MPSSLTARQREVLRFVRKFIADNGYPPTRSEISKGFGWNSVSAAEQHLRAIERKGAIRIKAGISRGISIIE